MGLTFGDRMKLYEGAESARRFTPMLPVIARLDGRNFSGYTRGLGRPYDQRLSDLMADTVTHLVTETGAVMGYTQSDEITLAWYSSKFDSQIFFDGRVQKMVSTLAAMCSVYFNRRAPAVLPEKADQTPTFDCRAWTVPTLEEGVNVFLWRETDCTKNSISMAAHHYYSAAQLHGRTGSEKQELLFQKGVNWNDYPEFFKRGVYVQRRTEKRTFRPDELADLPPEHRARQNPELAFERSVYRRLVMPPLTRVANRVPVVFYGADPLTAPEPQGDAAP